MATLLVGHNSRSYKSPRERRLFPIPNGYRFRSLITYFARRGRSAFSEPFVHEPRQQEWDRQVHNAFLLGLNFDYPAKAQELKDREKMLNSLRKAAKAGT